MTIWRRCTSRLSAQMNYWKLKLRRMRHGLKRTSKRKLITISAIAVCILGAMGWGSNRLFDILAHSGDFPLFFRAFIAEKIILMVGMIMFAMIVLSAMISTLNTFFLSADLAMLMATPMPYSRIFIWKTIDTLLTSTAMATLFFLPVLAGYCIHFGKGLVGIFLVFALFILLAAFTGILIGMVVPLFISIRRLQPALSIIGILLISSVVILMRWIQPEQFFRPGAIENLMNYMQGLDLKALTATPFYWMSRAMGALSQGDLRGFLIFAGLLGASLLIVMACLTVIRKRLYLPLLDRIHCSNRFRGTRSSSRKRRSVHSALLRKEMVTFSRSPDQWSQLIIIAAITVVFILNIRAIPRIHPGVDILTAFLNMGVTAFVIAGLNSRFAFPSMPMEDRGIVHVLASPAPRKSLLHMKLLAYIPPQVLLGLCIFLAGHWILHQDTFMLLTGLVFLIPGLIYISLLAFRYGLEVLPGPNETPENLLLSRSGITFMLTSLAFIIASMLLFTLPIARFYLHLFHKLPAPTAIICAWYGGFLFIVFLLSRHALRKSYSLWETWES